MRKQYSPKEIKKALFDDVLYYYDSSLHVEYKPKAIETILNAFESVDYNIYDFFDKREYVTISPSKARYDIMSFFLEYCPLREILRRYSDCIADCDFFVNEDKSNIRIYHSKQGYPISSLKEETIRRLFLMETEEDLWTWIADGNGDFFSLFQYYELEEDKKSIDFLKFVVTIVRYFFPRPKRLWM